MRDRIRKYAKRFLAGSTVFALIVFAAVLVLHKDSSIQNGIWINSPPQAVWNVLAETNQYPAWNPMITRLTGQLRAGNVIEFTNGSGTDSMVFHPTILAVQPNQELRWKGYVWNPGIFDGEHRFLLEAKGHGTYFTQSETFTGLLAGKLTSGILQETVNHMQAMNLALKRRTEAHITLKRL